MPITLRPSQELRDRLTAAGRSTYSVISHGQIWPDLLDLDLMELWLTGPDFTLSFQDFLVYKSMPSIRAALFGVAVEELRGRMTRAGCTEEAWDGAVRLRIVEHTRPGAYVNTMPEPLAPEGSPARVGTARRMELEVPDLHVRLNTGMVGHGFLKVLSGDSEDRHVIDSERAHIPTGHATPGGLRTVGDLQSDEGVKPFVMWLWSASLDLIGVIKATLSPDLRPDLNVLPGYEDALRIPEIGGLRPVSHPASVTVRLTSTVDTADFVARVLQKVHEQWLALGRGFWVTVFVGSGTLPQQASMTYERLMLALEGQDLAGGVIWLFQERACLTMQLYGTILDLSSRRYERDDIAEADNRKLFVLHCVVDGRLDFGTVPVPRSLHRQPAVLRSEIIKNLLFSLGLPMSRSPAPPAHLQDHLGGPIHWSTRADRIPTVQRVWAAAAAESPDLLDMIEGFTMTSSEFYIFVLMSSSGCSLPELRWALLGRARIRTPGLTFSPFIEE